ncbi:MAG: ATP-binding protein, partial [Acidobacteriota bacterium]
MRFERVHAIHFGPFDDEQLEFSRGFNLIYGPNEAGKSTWHAAILAGLCNFKRGRGKNVIYDEFRYRHRPWNADSWKVNLVVHLNDD